MPANNTINKMSNYRRNYQGNSYFFTLVTKQRRPIFNDEDARATLRQLIQAAKERWPFAIDAWVLLPEHMHCIWTLPDDDHDYSKRWGWIKKEFSKQTLEKVGPARQTPSSFGKRESGIWQRRFWEHTIRDEHDFSAHCDYIHYNPVKHGLAVNPADWPYSTFHRFVKEGIYPASWGQTVPQLADNIGQE